ncbi:hypothetical protein D3C87_2104790 [compost metagenome]
MQTYDSQLDRPSDEAPRGQGRRVVNEFKREYPGKMIEDKLIWTVESFEYRKRKALGRDYDGLQPRAYVLDFTI